MLYLKSGGSTPATQGVLCQPAPRFTCARHANRMVGATTEEAMDHPAHADDPRSRQSPAPRRRERLDVVVHARGLAPSRERARALIMAGVVRVDGRLRDKPGTLVASDAQVELVGPSPELRYASRGGLKLERALDAFGVDPAGQVCVDVGASTGGFTDVLLLRGAARVYAVDVGRGQLAWQLRSDPRVVVMERTNIRYLTALPEPAMGATIDVSFISLRLVLPPVAALLVPSGWIVALVKPQFEAGRAEVDRGSGVISDPAVHRTVLHGLLAWIAQTGPQAGRRLEVRRLIPSPIVGRDGNHEYLLHLAVMPDSSDGAPPGGAGLNEAQIDAVVADAFAKGAEVNPERGRR
jgi:23S rRNA (cytidine1920-2'-O)/16S rRNA (cytidine1409-2'-O)-methyltransferase